jgi:hypothetical protein
MLVPISTWSIHADNQYAGTSSSGAGRTAAMPSGHPARQIQAFGKAMYDGVQCWHPLARRQDATNTLPSSIVVASGCLYCPFRTTPISLQNTPARVTVRRCCPDVVPLRVYNVPYDVGRVFYCSDGPSFSALQAVPEICSSEYF